MITLEQAKGLKKGDVVYADGYKGYVIEVTINEKDASAKIIYTDGGAGGDEFTGRTNDPRFSLTR